jgi:hypothetical protein
MKRRQLNGLAPQNQPEFPNLLDGSLAPERRGIPELLSARFVKTVVKPGFYADGGRLYLRVDPSGAKRWIFRYKLRGKQSDMGFGSTLMVTLREARDKAVDARRLIARGVDPLQDKRGAIVAAKSRKTFQNAFLAVIDAKQKLNKSSSYIRSLISVNRLYCASIQPLFVDQIQQSTVINVLDSISSDGVKHKVRALIYGACFLQGTSVESGG